MQDEIFCYFTTYLKTADLQFEMQMLMQSLFPEFLSVEYLILVMWVKSLDKTFSVVLNILNNLGLKMINQRWPLFPETRRRDPSKVPVMAQLPDKLNTLD